MAISSPGNYGRNRGSLMFTDTKVRQIMGVSLMKMIGSVIMPIAVNRRKMLYVYSCAAFNDYFNSVEPPLFTGSEYR
jgi:hypothetical protein